MGTASLPPSPVNEQSSLIAPNALMRELSSSLRVFKYVTWLPVFFGSGLRING